MKEPQEPSRPLLDEMRRGLLGKLLAPLLIIFVVLVLDLSYVARPALVWDETYYYPFATEVAAWFAHPTLDEAAVNKAFREGNAHPPLPLYVMAVTEKLFHSTEDDYLFALRLASVVEFAALAVVVYVFVKGAAGAAAGAFAAGLTVFCPRLFAHSILATYDVPLALFWVAATAAFYKGMTSRAWAVVSGALFGLALLTKVNAFLLPVALWPWGIYYFRGKSVRAILSMCVIGPTVFFAGWPWLWLHPLRNFAEYIADKFPPGVLPSFLTSATGTASVAWREAMPTLYFGNASPSGPPWHYPFVITLITMPLAALFGSVLSGLSAKREKASRPLPALLWWSVLVQLAVFAFVMKPFDGERLFLPVLPLVAMAAGMGLAWIAKKGIPLAAVAVVVSLVSPAAEFFVYEPYGMSYFSPAVGGLPGAERLGMEVTYYGEAVDPAAFAAVNSRAREGQRIAYGPMFKKLPWRMPLEFMRFGFLRVKLAPVSPAEDWDYLIFVNRGGSITDADKAALAKGTVIHENRLLGVTLSEVLERRGEAQRETGNASGQR